MVRDGIIIAQVGHCVRSEIVEVQGMLKCIKEHQSVSNALGYEHMNRAYGET